MAASLLFTGLAILLLVGALTGGEVGGFGFNIPSAVKPRARVAMGCLGLLILVGVGIATRVHTRATASSVTSSSASTSVEGANPPPRSTDETSTSGVGVGTVIRYLDEVQPSVTRGCGSIGRGSYTIGTLPAFNRSVANKAQKCTGGGPNYIEYTLNGACSEFETTLGVPNDQTQEAEAYLEIGVNGEPGPHASLRRGQAQHVSVSVKDAFVLRLTLVNTSSTNDSDPYVIGVFGDARLVCQS